MPASWIENHIDLMPPGPEPSHGRDGDGVAHPWSRLDEKDVAEMLEEMARGIFDPAFDISALRRACEPSRATLWRFRDALGCNPKAYLARHLGRAARRLLTESHAPLGVIAAGLGFRDAELFSKWFKGQTGQSPRQARGVGQAETPVPRERKRSLRRFRRLVLGGVGAREAASWVRHFVGDEDGG